MVVLGVLIHPLAAAPEDEVRATFDRFVAAQNDHDAKAVEALLLDSPNFLWITRGTPVWGADAAMKRFATLYQGTWRLDPEAASLKVMMLGDGVAQLYVPIVFTIGPSGQSAQPTRFLMNQAPGEDGEPVGRYPAFSRYRHLRSRITSKQSDLTVGRA